MMIVTCLIEIENIVPYGPEGRYKINFKERAREVPLIPFGTAKGGAMQGPRFCTWQQLMDCKDLGKILQFFSSFSMTRMTTMTRFP